MNWDDIKLVLAVARSGSLNRAAVTLGVNQSTVSRRLTALEADLAVTLFKRSPQGLVASDTGAAFVARAAEIEARAGDLVETMRQIDARPAGVIRLLGNQWVIEHLLRNGLRRFMDDNPGIDLRTMAGRPQSSLWRGEPGIALWFETAPVDGAVAIRLGQVPYAFYRSAAHDPPDWVAFFDENHPDRFAGLPIVQRIDPAARVRATAVDAATLREAIAAGIGRGLLPVCLGRDDPRLIRLVEGAPELERMMHFHAHPDTLGSPRVQVMLSWLRANFTALFASEGLAQKG